MWQKELQSGNRVVHITACPSGVLVGMQLDPMGLGVFTCRGRPQMSALRLLCIILPHPCRKHSSPSHHGKSHHTLNSSILDLEAQFMPPVQPILAWNSPIRLLSLTLPHQHPLSPDGFSQHQGPLAAQERLRMFTSVPIQNHRLAWILCLSLL